MLYSGLYYNITGINFVKNYKMFQSDIVHITSTLKAKQSTDFFGCAAVVGGIVQPHLPRAHCRISTAFILPHNIKLLDLFPGPGQFLLWKQSGGFN